MAAASIYRGLGDSIDLIAPAGGVIGGNMINIGGFFGVIGATAAVGEKFALHVVGVWVLPKVTGVAWTEGGNVYYDDTTKKATGTATGSKLIGLATKAAAAGDAFGEVRMNGVYPVVDS